MNPGSLDPLPGKINDISYQMYKNFDQKSYRTLSTYSFEKLLENYQKYVKY